MNKCNSSLVSHIMYFHILIICMARETSAIASPAASIMH